MADPISAGINLVGKFIDKYIPDKDLATTLKAEAASQEFAGVIQIDLGQMAVNQVEAAHKSIFVAGWRPYIGWVCGTGLLYNVLLYPVLNIWFEMPPVETALLYPPLMGMLGLGAMRTYEKANGVAREK